MNKLLNNPKRKKCSIKWSKTNLVQNGLRATIICVFILIILIFFIPCLYWIVNIVTGNISMTSLNMQTDDVITYSIGMLTLLVTIITLGIGLIALLGWRTLKDRAATTASKITKDLVSVELKSNHDTLNQFIADFNMNSQFPELFERIQLLEDKMVNLDAKCCNINVDVDIKTKDVDVIKMYSQDIYNEDCIQDDENENFIEKEPKE